MQGSDGYEEEKGGGRFLLLGTICHAWYALTRARTTRFIAFKVSETLQPMATEGEVELQS